MFNPNRSTASSADAYQTARLLYRDAEWLNAWAHLLGKANQQAQLDEGWRLIRGALFSGETEQHFDQVQYIGRDVLTESLTEIASRLPALASGEPLIALNTLSWDRTDVIQVSADMRGALIDVEGDTETLTAERSSLPTQPVMDDKGRWQRLMAVRAPSYGYRAYVVRGGLPGQVPDNTLSAERQTLESAELRVIFDDNGEIISLFDKIARREIVAPGQTLNHLVTYAELPPVLDSNLLAEEVASPVGTISDWRVTESGPIRAAIEISRQIDNSTITQKIRLWAHTRRVDFVTEVNCHTDQKLVRALFPLNIDLSHEGSHIQYAHNSQEWVDLSETGYGVALFSNGYHEFRLDGNIGSMTLIKRGDFTNHNVEQAMYGFTYSVYPHTGDWRDAEIIHRAYELTVPLRVIRPPASDNGFMDELIINESALPSAYSFVRPLTANIVIQAIKMADDGDGLIVVLHEAHERPGEASIHFAQLIASAVEVNLLQETRDQTANAPITIAGNDLHFTLHSFETKFFRVKLA